MVDPAVSRDNRFSPLADSQPPPVKMHDDPSQRENTYVWPKIGKTTRRCTKETQLVSHPTPAVRADHRSTHLQKEEMEQEVKGSCSPFQLGEVNSSHLQTDWKPYSTSYFLPGRIEGRPVQFLVDTGCTTNLIAKHVFNRLSSHTRSQLKESETHGLQADGSRLPFYGLLTVSARLRDLKIEEAFVVSEIREDVILGMPFLVDHHCAMEFRTPALVVDGRVLACTDRQGRQLTCSVQVVRATTLAARAEVVVSCRVTSKRYAPQGMVEGSDGALLVAASLNKPDGKGGLKVRCINLTECPVDLQSGAVIGSYTGVEDEDVRSDKQDGRRQSTVPPQTVPEMPPHLVPLWKKAKEGCSTQREADRVTQLLLQYQGVFSTGDRDIGQTSLVTHSIPLMEGTRPIRQPPHRLGPEKEAEAERQVQDLLKRGLIEPSSGAWSSPVVLVRKKDGDWRFCVDYRRLNAVTQQDAYPLPIRIR